MLKYSRMNGVYLPHNKSLSLCHCTGSSWPRAWSPPPGGWRGPGRPVARRWSWGAPGWWTSGWPGHRGINDTLLTSAGDLGVQDVSVSVQGNQHDAGAAEEHRGALDTAHSLAQPALQQDLDHIDLWHLIISPSKTSLSQFHILENTKTLSWLSKDRFYPIMNTDDKLSNSALTMSTPRGQYLRVMSTR